MRNVISRVVPTLLVSCSKVVNGLATDGAAIGLVQNTEEKLRLEAEALAVARDDYEFAKAAEMQQRHAMYAAAEAGREFLTLVRDILKPQLGKVYSQTWDVTGFAGSLAVPRDADGVQARLQALDGFFVANPSYEVPQLQLTATRCRELYNALVAAQTTLLLNVTTTDNLLRIRNEKSAIVRKRIRGVINELSQLISPTDARWFSFGLNMPGAEATPDTPQDVTATVINPTTAEVKWPKAPRAKYYRVRRKVVGGDSEMVSVSSPTDPDFMLEGLPPNSIIEVAVSSVNDGGESPLSEVVVIRT